MFMIAPKTSPHTPPKIASSSASPRPSHRTGPRITTALIPAQPATNI